MTKRKAKIPYIKNGEEKHYTFPTGLAQLTAHKNKVTPAKIETKQVEDINSQIEEFFKSGGQVKEINSEARSIPEWCWWQDNYPKNYRR